MLKSIISVADFWMGQYVVTQAQWQAIMGPKAVSLRKNAQLQLQIQDSAHRGCSEDQRIILFEHGTTNNSESDHRQFHQPSEQEGPRLPHSCRTGRTSSLRRCW